MKKFRLTPLSIRSQILLMMLGTIIVVQAAILYAGNYMREKFLTDVISGHITTTIRFIRATISLIPPEQRAQFIFDASKGKWSLWTRQLPQGSERKRLGRSGAGQGHGQGLGFGRQLNAENSAVFDTERKVTPADRHSAIQQLFPHLKEQKEPPRISRDLYRQNAHPQHHIEYPSGDIRNDLRQMIVRINQDLDDGTRVGFSRGSQATMYISLLPELNLLDNTLIKEWLVIPLDSIDPHDNNILLLSWLALTALLLLGAGFFAWHITTPLMRLSQSADKLARGIHAKVSPSGPYETRALGERFNAMLNSLEQAKTVQQTLLAGLPHDLKGPLARMRLRLEMCDDEMLKDGMGNDVQEMQGIIEQFISYVRGSDPARYQFSDMDLNLWLDERVGAWEGAGSPVHLRQRPKNPMMISGDSLALGRLVDNLIGNALKHGKPPVEIYLSQTDATHALISVCDHGPGIPAERREEALRAFSRLDSARTKTGSVGLGLALVETITHAHHGTLDLKDSESGGLRVDITLPLITQTKPKAK